MSKSQTTPTIYIFVQTNIKALDSLKRQGFSEVKDFANPQRHQYGIDANNALWYTNPSRKW